MKTALGISFVVALAGAMPMTACTSTRTSDSTGEYIDDSAITAKVKSALAADSFLSSFDIGVDTTRDVVQLSGSVDSEQIRNRAGQVTAGVSGVRGVENDLTVN